MAATQETVVALKAQLEAVAAQVAALAALINTGMAVMDARSINARARAQNMAKLAAGAALVPLQKEQQPGAGTLPPPNLFPADLDRVAVWKVRKQEHTKERSSSEGSESARIRKLGRI